MRDERKEALLDVLKILGITVVVYAGIRFLLPLVFPFLFALLLARLFYPGVEWLHKKLKWKKSWLATVVLVLFLAVILVLLWILFQKLMEQVQSLICQMPIYRQQAATFWNSCCVQLEHYTGVEAENLQQQVSRTLPQLWQQFQSTLLPSLMSGSVTWIRGMVVALGVCVVIGISTLLILKDYQKLYQRVGRNPLGGSLQRIASGVYRAGGGYIKAQICIMLVVSAVCVIGLFCTGNSYALLAGMGIGLCDALPFLGTGTILIPWAILQLVQGEYILAAAYAVIYTITSLIRELLEPKLVGNRLGIPPLVVVISVYVGLCIYGLLGFALGPLTYILVREIWRETKYLDKEKVLS